MGYYVPNPTAFLRKQSSKEDATARKRKEDIMGNGNSMSRLQAARKRTENSMIQSSKGCTMVEKKGGSKSEPE